MTSQIILQGISTTDLINKIDQIIQVRINEQTKHLRKSKYSEKEYLTGKEVEELLDISAPTRYEWEKKGLFSRLKINGRTRYKTLEILNAFERIENAKNL